MKLIDGKKYYTIEEAATLSGVSVRTVRRWISDGRLSDFIYPFRASPSELLYRLEPPEDHEKQNKKGEWIIPPQSDGTTKGGMVSESICGT